MSLTNSIDNNKRVSLLKLKLGLKKHLKIIEVHNGLSALIGEKIQLDSKSGQKIEFDGFWESSLTDSASKGFPDIELVGLDSRLDTINQILEVTNKPIIVDGDTGGDFNQFEYMVKRLERAGVSMVIIEDKIFPKRNSLAAGTKQELENLEIFSEKINRGIKIKQNKDFMVVARLESLIAGLGLADAIERCQAYLKAGADGIMIHSKEQNPAEVLKFAREFYKLPARLIKNKVLVCVPTAYNTITDSELAKNGFRIIIHANHLLRSACKAMEETAKTILKNDRSFEADSACSPVSGIFEKVGFLNVTEKDKLAADKLKSKIKVIIPAAGKSALASLLKTPISLIDINGRSVLERQLETLTKSGLNNVVVITGYKADNFKLENIKYYRNSNYQKNFVIRSLFTAENELTGAFIYLNSDILFSASIIEKLKELTTNKAADVVLLVDNSYQYHKHNVEKKLDLVKTAKIGKASNFIRQLKHELNEEVKLIGKNLSQEQADYEFVGLAYFSQRGAKIIKEVYKSIKNRRGNFHEAKSVNLAGLTDLIQEVIDVGYTVKVITTYQGWLELHNKKDLEYAIKAYK